MKPLIQAVTVFAMAHLLALLGVIGWLAATKRITPDRVEQIREILHEPEAVQESTDQDGEDPGDGGAVDGGPGPAKIGEPLSAAAALKVHLQEQDLHQERIARLQREVADLSSLLTKMRQKLDDERETFASERAAFEQTRTDLQATEGQEQFRKALGVLSSLKADKAKTLLDQLIRDGTFGGAFADASDGAALSGIDQAVSYLNEMPSRQSAKIINEFLDDDPALANELLERLRTRGQVALASGG